MLLFYGLHKNLWKVDDDGELHTDLRPDIAEE